MTIGGFASGWYEYNLLTANCLQFVKTARPSFRETDLRGCSDDGSDGDDDVDDDDDDDDNDDDIDDSGDSGNNYCVKLQERDLEF